jgi:hypothetical protein
VSGKFVAGLLLVALSAGCSVERNTTPPPTPGPPLSQADLRYRLIDELGQPWFCDPDFYPVARADEAALAIERFPDVHADRDAFTAIVAHLGLAAEADFTDEQKLAIYRASKQLEAIVLDPIGDGRYRFDYLSLPAPGAGEGRRTAGTIDASGSITVEQQAPAGEPPCPICLAAGTRIATPDGDIAIEDVRVGMLVWSLDEAGRRMVATVVRAGRTPVSATHRIVRLVLDDGRIVRASPGHPLADGRRLDTVGPGDRVDGAIVVSATLEAYDGKRTFDLLPDGPTGIYLADMVPLGSTLPD